MLKFRTLYLIFNIISFVGAFIHLKDFPPQSTPFKPVGSSVSRKQVALYEDLRKHSDKERAFDVEDKDRQDQALTNSPITEVEDELTLQEYIFGKKGELLNDLQRNGVSPRRLFLYTSLAGGLAIGADFLGVTSRLLSLSPEFAAKWKLDTLYPVSGFKRYVDENGEYEFIYPQSWLQDQAVAYSNQMGKVKSLDPLSRYSKNKQSSLKPKVAFGPPGGTFQENVSVIKSSVLPGFTLKGTLGNPKDAAEKLLSMFIAPENSGKEWTLLDAFQENRNGYEVYQFEYLIKSSTFFLHNIGVIATKTGEDLFTLIVLTPQTDWEKKQKALKKVATSFQLR